MTPLRLFTFAFWAFFLSLLIVRWLLAWERRGEGGIRFWVPFLFYSLVFAFLGLVVGGWPRPDALTVMDVDFLFSIRRYSSPFLSLPTVNDPLRSSIMALRHHHPPPRISPERGRKGIPVPLLLPSSPPCL